MSKIFLKKHLSTSKSNLLNDFFNARADDLAEEKGSIPLENKERFLDMVSNVKDKELRQRLINRYLKDEDILGYECGRLSKKYYFNGFSDCMKLVLECINN